MKTIVEDLLREVIDVVRGPFYGALLPESGEGRDVHLSDELEILKEFGLARLVVSNDDTRSWGATDKLRADMKAAAHDERVDLHKPTKKVRISPKQDRIYCRLFERSIESRYVFITSFIGGLWEMIEIGKLALVFADDGIATYHPTPRAFFCGVSDKNVDKRQRAIFIDLERRGLMKHAWPGRMEWWPTPEGFSKGLGTSEGPVSDLLRDLGYDLDESSRMNAVN